MIEIWDESQHTAGLEHGLVHILKNLRACDAHEIASVGATLDDAKRLVMQADDVFQAVEGDGSRWKSVFVFGSVPTYPHVRGIFGFGTDKTTRVMPAVSRFIKEVWEPSHFNERGTRRIEVRLPVSCSHSINWLTKLGMEPECTLSGISIFGEQYIQLARTKDAFDVLQPLQERGTASLRDRPRSA